MAGGAGWDILALIQEETCEHDRPTKRYDKLGKSIERFRSQILESNNKFKFKKI